MELRVIEQSIKENNIQKAISNIYEFIENYKTTDLMKFISKNIIIGKEIKRQIEIKDLKMSDMKQDIENINDIIDDNFYRCYFGTKFVTVYNVEISAVKRIFELISDYVNLRNNKINKKESIIKSLKNIKINEKYTLLIEDGLNSLISKMVKIEKIEEVDGVFNIQYKEKGKRKLIEVNTFENNIAVYEGWQKLKGILDKNDRHFVWSSLKSNFNSILGLNKIEPITIF